VLTLTRWVHEGSGIVEDQVGFRGRDRHQSKACFYLLTDHERSSCECLLPVRCGARLAGGQAVGRDPDQS